MTHHTDSLRNLIARGQLKTPVQRGFSQAAWSTALANIASPSNDDIRLHSAAVFFGKQLAGLRQELAKRPVPHGKEIQLLRRAVGAVNYQSALIADTVHKQSLPEVFFVSDLIQNEISLANGINSASRAEVIESAVDGLRFELHGLRHSPVMERCVGLSALNRIAARMNFSVFYHMLEEEWLDCLHHGYAIVSNGKNNAIEPVDLKHARDHVVGEFREHAIDMELMFRGRDFFRIYPDVKGVVRDASKKGGYRVITVPDEIRDLIARTRFLAAEPELEEVLDCVIDSTTGLTARDALGVWESLVPLAHQATTPTPRHKVLKSPSQMEELAPIHHLASLERAVHAATGISLQRCRAAIVALSWRDSRDSLWHRPIVPIDHKNVVIVNPALHAPNLRRSIEYWLAQGSADLSVRGRVFETEVRESLAGCTTRNAQLKQASIWQGKLEPADSEVGDIDLLGWVGNTILIGETKCFLRPATSHEWFQHDNSIQKAAAQIERKAAWLRANLPWLSNQTGHVFSPGSQVVPCVVVNCHSTALRVIDGVPIVDVNILARFFADGFGVLFASVNDETSGKKVLFYSNDCEAAAVLPEYLRRPPHLIDYLDSIETGSRRQPDFDTLGPWIELKFLRVKVKVPEDVRLANRVIESSP